MLLPADCRDSNNSTFVQKSIYMKIAKKKVRIQSFIVNPIIDLERLLEKVLEKAKYIVIKCNKTPGDNDSGSITL